MSKEILPIGRGKPRRIVGVDPKNMSIAERIGMMKVHSGDIVRAANAHEFSTVEMLANRIARLAELNAQEEKMNK